MNRGEKRQLERDIVDAGRSLLDPLYCMVRGRVSKRVSNSLRGKWENLHDLLPKIDWDSRGVPYKQAGVHTGVELGSYKWWSGDYSYPERRSPAPPLPGRAGKVWGA